MSYRRQDSSCSDATHVQVGPYQASSCSDATHVQVGPYQASRKDVSVTATEGSASADSKVRIVAR